jgi:hypothetical protein
MVWAVAERGSTRNGNKHGWPFDYSRTSAVCCTLWGVELSGCCAEMVAHGEGRKCHNPSGDNQEFSCTMAQRHILHWAYIPGWIRSFRDVGWDDEDLKNGLQELQISRPVTFSCGAGQRRRCTGQNPAQLNNWRTVPHDFLLKTVHSIPGRWGSCWMSPVHKLNFKLPFKKAHLKISFLTVILEMQSFDHFSMPTYFPTNLISYYWIHGTQIKHQYQHINIPCIYFNNGVSKPHTLCQARIIRGVHTYCFLRGRQTDSKYSENNTRST